MLFPHKTTLSKEQKNTRKWPKCRNSHVAGKKKRKKEMKKEKKKMRLTGCEGRQRSKSEYQSEQKNKENKSKQDTGKSKMQCRTGKCPF